MSTVTSTDADAAGTTPTARHATAGRQASRLSLARSDLGQWKGPVDPRDNATPDDWVPRHPSMIRLTGRHPFNSEAPLSTLMSASKATNGLTPNSLHYVRNHGSVPRLDWDTHVLHVDFALGDGGSAGYAGLAGLQPCRFTMRELVAMASETVEVTLSCAGNRRHEQNVVKKSQGFSWGPSAASTAAWTGVPLHRLLAACGVEPAALQAGSATARPLFVNFAGSDSLPKGVYGTTTTLQHAMDPTSDILLAYEMNGE
ncbi:hypothetical protein HK405_013694, partial [Cladochytrium tenue]